jgi:hypothetical protein
MKAISIQEQLKAVIDASIKEDVAFGDCTSEGMTHILEIRFFRHDIHISRPISIFHSHRT